MSYFLKYKTQIYGLTGTLGSDAVKSLLEGVYNVDMFDMPPYRERLLKEVTGRIDTSRINWLQTIYENIVEQCKKRCVLVICESVVDAKELEIFLE